MTAICNISAKAGETYLIEVTVLDRDGEPRDLSGVTLTYGVQRVGGALVTKAATVVEATAGRADIEHSLFQPGQYRQELKAVAGADVDYVFEGRVFIAPALFPAG